MKLVVLEKFQIKKGLEERGRQALRQTRFLQVGLKGGGRGILLGGILTIQCLCHAGQHSVDID